MRISSFNELIEDGKKQKGRWFIGKSGELQYRSSGKDEEVKARAGVIAAEPGALVIALTERQTDQKSTTHLAKLTGSWKADARNRLVFEVERESGRKDELTFTGAWELDRNQRLLYRLRRRALKTRTRHSGELFFEGHWDLSEKNRLTYRLSGGADSALELRGAFETKSILAKKGEIRYQIGAQADGRTLTLFGKWKYSDKLGLSFEMGTSRSRLLSFGGDVRLNKRDELSVLLKSRRGEPLGAEVVFSRALAGGEIFLRLNKGLEESRVEAGLRRKF